MATKKGAFKNKGSEILRTPSSMGDFLKDTPDSEPATESQDAQTHISTNTHKVEEPDTITKARPKTKETERFHLNIRKDLADKVFDEILFRKRIKNGQKPTQTAIFEEALESYFS